VSLAGVAWPRIGGSRITCAQRLSREPRSLLQGQLPYQLAVPLSVALRLVSSTSRAWHVMGRASRLSERIPSADIFGSKSRLGMRSGMRRPL
jgi:hypothetical protein